MYFARAVGRQNDQRRLAGTHGAELGNGDLEFRKQLEQVPFEFLIGPIDFVNQEDGRARTGRIDRLEERALDEKSVAVQLTAGADAVDGVRRFENAQLDELASVVPFVNRVADVEAFVTLEAYQIGFEGPSNGARERCLADAGFTLEKKRASELQREKQRNGQASIRDVLLGRELRLEIGNGSGKNGLTPSGRSAGL